MKKLSFNILCSSNDRANAPMCCRAPALRGFAVAVMLLLTGCESLPASLSVPLGNSTTVTASINSGPASFASSTWAYYASGTSPLGFLGGLLPGSQALMFRAEHGANGQILRIFDNQALGPDKFGPFILMDNLLHPMIAPPTLSYASASYGAADGSFVGLVGYCLIYSPPFSIIKVTIVFSGTEDPLLNRINGNFKFISEVNPFFAGLAPSDVQSETVEVDGYAIKES